MRASGSKLPSRKATRVVAVAVIAACSLTWTLEAAYADPPPWAPAWGYRAKNKGKKHKKKYQNAPVVYEVPYGIDSGRCNRQLIGGLIGGATGGLLGSQIGKGDGNIAAIVGGAILGLIVGGSIGRSMDRIDQNCVGQTLEHAEDGRAVAWQNPDTGVRYQVTPEQTYRDNSGRYCREYTTTSVVGGKSQQVYGTACRQPDGSWQLGG